MTDRTLVETILESPRRREAVQQLVIMMLEHERQGRLNARYEIQISGGRRVSSVLHTQFQERCIAPDDAVDRAERAERMAA